MNKICKVDGCNNLLTKHSAKGMCYKHYKRFHKYGDPNITHISAQTHGMYYTPEYRIWSGMLTRCYNKKEPCYKYYGGRGITVCDRWKKSFESFYENMGNRPSKDYQIDRIDNNGNYEPSNCRWVTKTANARNKNCTKLSMKIAREIRALYGEYNQRELSIKYNVSWANIYKIVHNKIWKEGMV